MFVVIVIVAGLINVFSSHLVSLFYNVSVWWHIVGVAAIVVILIVVPSHHASFSYVFSHRANESGFSGGANTGAKFWFYVLPLGFLLTMYTITGYDASAHVSEETHGAEESARKGHLALGRSTRRCSAGSCCSRSRSRSRRATKRKSTKPASRR